MHELGQMRKRVDIQSVFMNRGTSGAQKPAYTTYRTCYASLDPASAGESEAGGANQLTRNYTVRLRYFAELSPKDQIVYGDRTFQIKSIENEGELNLNWILEVVERSASG